MTSRAVVKKHQSESPLEHRLRTIKPGDQEDLATIAQLHMALLHFGPMSGLGKLFVREICYGVHLQDGLLRVGLYEINERPVGFVAYTSRSITFHRKALRSHWLYATWVLVISIVVDPRRLPRLLRALRVVFSRRAEQNLEQDPLGEIVAIGVLPDYLTPEFVRRTGLQVSEELVVHVLSYFQQKGLRRMRMIVEADNKPALLFYHRLGARFEDYEQAGEPQVQLWFDLDKL